MTRKTGAYKRMMTRLNHYKYREGFTFTEIARRTGVPRNTVARMFNSEPVSIHVMFTVLEGLGFVVDVREEVE